MTRPPPTHYSVSTTPGTAVAITLSGSDVEGSALSYSVVSSPSSGTLSGTAPNLTYTPNSGFTGSDSFTYQVNDGALNSATATVSIQVNTPAASSGGGGLCSIELIGLLSLLGLARKR